jgi:glycosyltransferase involved in cell wall biosynthesis
VPRDRELSAAQQSGVDPGWFQHEVATVRLSAGRNFAGLYLLVRVAGARANRCLSPCRLREHSRAQDDDSLNVAALSASHIHRVAALVGRARSRANGPSRENRRGRSVAAAVAGFVEERSCQLRLADAGHRQGVYLDARPGRRFMRVALLSWESLHTITVGGVAAHVTELAASLERRGHDVHLFTRGRADQPLYQRLDGVHYHACPFTLQADFVDEIEDFCRSIVHHVFATEDFTGRPFDVVHAHDWLTSTAMAWIKCGRGRKSVLTFHSTEYGRCGNNFHPGRSARIRSIERAATYWADRVVAVSDSLRHELMWMYEVPGWKTRTTYNGVNHRRFDGWVAPAEVKARYGIGPMDPTVLFCGRMVYQKGPDLLVEAIPYVLRYHPATKFVFNGDGEMRGEVEHRARQLGVAHATRMLGARNGNGLIDLYRACDVVCVPSRNEPFGIVILEAWSAGKPVVVSKNGGPDEYVWHEVNGLKIHPTPESVAWGLGTLFTNFEWARWMGANGRLAVEKAFNWDAIGDQILDVYRN